MAGSPRLTRRALLAATLAGACSRKRGTRIEGWLLVASGAGQGVAVIDLASFHRVANIALPCPADELFRARGSVYALCREGLAIFELSIENTRILGKIALPGKPIAVRVTGDGNEAVVATSSPAMLLRVDLKHRQIISRVNLPGDPADLDTSGSLAVIAIPGNKSLVRASLPQLALQTTDMGVVCKPVRFRRDGKTILAGAPDARQIVTVDASSGALLARLSLPMEPTRFCFNGDGGQMFVTGKGRDALAIVSPYQNEVDQTILAGHTPNGMAVSDSRNLLFVTNSDSGDLSILDIDTRGLTASVHVGENPGEVLLTPDGEYALVMDPKSGNVSVVRLQTVLDRKVKVKPLFTVFSTTSDARSAVIMPFADQSAS